MEFTAYNELTEDQQLIVNTIKSQGEITEIEWEYYLINGVPVKNMGGEDIKRKSKVTYILDSIVILWYDYFKYFGDADSGKNIQKFKII